MDQSSTPWRVFDAPAAPEAGTVGARPSAPVASGGLPIQPHVLIALVAAIGIGVIAVAVAIGGVGNQVGIGPDASGSDAPRPTGRAGEIVVDVAGAVVTPGVYRFAAGARVGDAIDAAGGFSARVDADRAGAQLNLAAALTDGQQIRVPSRDDAPAGGGAAASHPSNESGSLLDLNTATQSELEALPGIGPVTAGKIIESRSQSPFRTIDELRERGLVGEKTFQTIKPLITAG